MWPAEAVLNQELKTKRTTKCTCLEPYVSLKTNALTFFSLESCENSHVKVVNLENARQGPKLAEKQKKHIPNGQRRRNQHRNRCFLALRVVVEHRHPAESNISKRIFPKFLGGENDYEIFEIT